jgi:hypothetical protein
MISRRYRWVGFVMVVRPRRSRTRSLSCDRCSYLVRGVARRDATPTARAHLGQCPLRDWPRPLFEEGRR